MSDEDYDWLMRLGESILVSGSYAPEEGDLERIMWLLPRCGFDESQPQNTWKNPPAMGRLIIQMRERLSTEGRNLSRALAELYTLTDPKERAEATRVVRDLSESGLTELHREEAKKVLRAIEAGHL